MVKNRNRNKSQASEVVFGFQFQIYAGIYLMLKYIREFESIGIEGKYEDIEISLSNKAHIYAQAKSANRPFDISDSEARKKFKSAVRTLGALPCGKEDLLVYVTNITERPFGEKSTLFDGCENFYHYGDLNDVLRKKIDELIANSEGAKINKDRLVIMTLPFFGEDNRQRVKVVKDELIQVLGSIKPALVSQATTLLEHWDSVMFANGATKDTKIVVEKADVVWDLIFQLIEINSDYGRIQEELGLDSDVMLSARTAYGGIIERDQMGFSYYNILNRMRDQYVANHAGSKIRDFILDNTEEISFALFPDGLADCKDSRVINACASIVAYKILTRKIEIEDVFREVNYGY